MDFLFKTINWEENYLDFLRAKNHVIVSNLANAETPFYKRL
jgi:flagellar basal body rod protein FlgB